MGTISAYFGKALGNNKGSVQNFGIVGVTIATEEIAKFVFFYCPCNYPENQVYGSAFIWGPAFILLVAGYLANRRTWRLTTGLCNREQGIGKGGKRIFHFIFIFFQIGMKAMIAPGTWFLLAMLKGDYYACAKWPNPYEDTEASRASLKMAPQNGTNLPSPCQFHHDPKKFPYASPGEAEIIARNLRAESHVIGWFYICIAMLLGVVGMFLARCKSRFSYEQGNFIERYRSSEVDAFEDRLSEKAREQAEAIVEHYFSKPRSKLEWDQIAVINDKVTKSKRGRPIYSPLHNFVNKELRRNDEKLKVDDLVTSAAVGGSKLGLFKKKTAAPAAAAAAAGSGVGDKTALLGAAAMMSATSSKKPAPVQMKDLSKTTTTPQPLQPPASTTTTEKKDDPVTTTPETTDKKEDVAAVVETAGGDVKETALVEEPTSAAQQQQDEVEFSEQAEQEPGDDTPLL